MRRSAVAYRLKRELINFNGETGFEIEMVDDDMNDLVGSFPGPPDTPYAGGKFWLEIKIPDTFPMNPPKIRFKTPVWHPNVSSVSGSICLDVLSTKWVPAISLHAAMLSIQSLLSSPQSDDPQDAVVANQYKARFYIFKKTARYWTAVYAGGTYENRYFDQILTSLQGKPS